MEDQSDVSDVSEESEEVTSEDELTAESEEGNNLTVVSNLKTLPSIVISQPVNDVTRIGAAPPIPAELIQPAVPTSVTKQATIQITKPTLVSVKTRVNQKQIEPILDSLLIKGLNESQTFFDIRSTYSKIALSVFQDKINMATAILLGHMAASKAMYGLTYPEDSDRVIRYINEQIVNNY